MVVERGSFASLSFAAPAPLEGVGAVKLSGCGEAVRTKKATFCGRGGGVSWCLAYEKERKVALKEVPTGISLQYPERVCLRAVLQRACMHATWCLGSKGCACTPRGL